MAITVALTGCTDHSQIDSLNAQVQSLQPQVSNLETTAQATKAAHAREVRDLGRCIRQLVGVAQEIESVAYYYSHEGKILGPPLYFKQKRCSGIVPGGSLHRVSKSAAGVIVQMRHMGTQRLNASINRILAGSSGGGGSGGPTAQCNDGTFSYSDHAQGAWHGGADHWINYP